MENIKVGVGVGVMIVKNGKVLLGKRNGDPKKASSLLNGAGTWTMPGGKLDFGETFEECAKRETEEETGIKLNSVKVICINQDIVETAHFITIGLFSDDFSGEPKTMEPEKITDWQWFNLDNLPNPVYFPSANVLKNYNQKKFYISKQIIKEISKIVETACNKKRSPSLITKRTERVKSIRRSLVNCYPEKTY